MPKRIKFSLFSLHLSVLVVGACQPGNPTPMEAGECAGTATLCGDLSDSECGTVPGCSLAGPTRCTGSATNCSSLNYSPSSCVRQLGCYPNSIGFSTFCNGSSTDCDDVSASFCSRQQGCSLQGGCRGETPPCASIHASATCRAQRGCSWRPLTDAGMPAPDQGLSPDRCFSMYSGPGVAANVGCNGEPRGIGLPNRLFGSCTPSSSAQGTCTDSGQVCHDTCTYACALPPGVYVSASTCPTGSRCFRTAAGAGLCFPDCRTSGQCVSNQCDADGSCEL